MIELAPYIGRELTYDEAWLYCATLDFKNHRDWRMPTVAEYGRHFGIYGWFEGSAPYIPSYEYNMITPVRDK